MCEVNITLERQIPTQRWLVVIESCLPSPHCLVAQDVALSRPKRGFEFLWGHKNNNCFQNEDPRKGILFVLLWGHKKQQMFSKRGSPEGDLFVLLWGHRINNCFQNEDPRKGILFVLSRLLRAFSHFHSPTLVVFQYINP